MRSRLLMHCKKSVFCYSQVILISWLPFSAYAADLSEGLKGLRVGMTKSEAFSILKKQEERAGGFFAPASTCEPDSLGEKCSIYGSNLTYGKIQLLIWRLHFGRGGDGLDHVRLLLSKAGCEGNSGTPHPRVQFEILSARLTEHYGTPSSAEENVKVWVDTKIKAGLVLALYAMPLPGVGYPNCPISSVSLTTDKHNRMASQASAASSARENDL